MFKLLFHHHHPASQRTNILPKCKKIEELLVSIVIIIKKLGVSHGFVFPETLEVSKKGTNNESAMQQSLTKNDTYCSGIKKVIKLSNKVLSVVVVNFVYTQS